MMIFIGIILIFLGMYIYIPDSTRCKSNIWLSILGFLMMMTGGIIIGMIIDGKL